MARCAQLGHLCPYTWPVTTLKCRPWPDFLRQQHGVFQQHRPQADLGHTIGRCSAAFPNRPFWESAIKINSSRQFFEKNQCVETAAFSLLVASKGTPKQDQRIKKYQLLWLYFRSYLLTTLSDHHPSPQQLEYQNVDETR